MMYEEDHHGLLPIMRTPEELQKSLATYVDSSRLNWIFLSYPTKKPFKPNANISGKQIRSFPDPSIVPCVYDADPGPKGEHIAGYLDGHTKTVPAQDWQKLQAKWGLK